MTDLVDARRGSTTRMVARILLGLYLACVALIALWPTPVDADSRDLIDELLQFLRAHGNHWFRYKQLEFAANVALFVPLGVLGAVVTGRAWVAALAGLLLSGTIEIVQAVFLPERTAAISDVIANTAGAVLGALVVAVSRGLASLVRRRRAARAP